MVKVPIYPEKRYQTTDVRDTLKAMKIIMDRFCIMQPFRNLAVAITRGCRGKDKRAEAQMVQDWIAMNIRYRLDPIGTEWIQWPSVSLQERAGDCDDMTILAGTLLQSLGHRCHPIAVQWDGHAAPSHAVLRDDSVKAIVDPVAGIKLADWPPKPYSVSRMVEA